MTNRATTEPSPATESSAPVGVAELATRMGDEVAVLDKELSEIELLIAQARTEATRHETRRATAAEKLATATTAAEARGETPPDAAELNAQLVLLTKRAALMESQVDVLEGKQRALSRFRETIGGYAEALSTAQDAAPEQAGSTGKARRAGPTSGAADPMGSLPPAVSRLLLGAQEDMRREIARAMHDGPAQSLTNIVLQAQIVERLIRSDPTRAANEVGQLVGMVQQTLEATKTFIFEVRPMVLDDLGLVPTLRRTARDRGRRAGVPIEFESMGQDRRLPMDLESGLFRILDEAVSGYLGARAERIALRLDWSADQLDASLTGSRAVASAKSAVDPNAATSKDLPPALAAMMQERIEDARTAAETAQRDSIVELPSSTWREIQGRAATLGLTIELSSNGSELRLLAELPTATTEG